MGDVVDFFEDVGDWVVGAAEDVGDWVEGAVEDTIDWVENAAEDTAEFFENDVKDFFENDVKDFIDGVGRSLEFFFTGSMDGDDGDNTLVALGFGGTINAYGGNDEIVTGGFYVDIYTGSGDDNVYGAGGGIDITDTDGNLGVYGASGSLSVDKTGNGNIVVGQASIASVIDHTGANGDLTFGGGSAYNELTRKGQSGNVSFKGLGGYNALWHETNHGSLSFEGAGAGNKLDRTWFDQYQGSGGDVTFDGGGASNIISSRVASGNIVFKGAGFYNDIERVGQSGDISVSGAGGYNSIKRTRNHQDEYAATRGNIRFEGFGGYNNIHSDVAHGNINFAGAGGYNDITRQGADSETSGVALATARAEEIVLTRATMGGSWILESQQVTGIKSNREPNTYLFAFADSTYTKINKVQLRNDPQTGKLTYYSTAWYKEGNHLTDLANQDISSASGFNAVNINGAYRLSNLTVEHRQTFTTEGVVDDLSEYEWHPYAGDAHINADDVTLSDAKMSGWAIRYNKELFDVSAVKSNRGKNTYVYGMLDGWHTKVVVVKLANDPETGALKYYAESWYKTGDFTADLANEDISAANGYHSMSTGGYSLSDHHYSVTGVRSSSQRLAHTEEYSDQTLFTPSTSSGESSGDVNFEGGGAANVIRSSVTRGDVNFDGGGIANVILHSSKYGNTDFEGGGGANVVVKSGLEGDLTFRGAGLANVLVHQSQKGKMDVYAGGAVNVLVRIGDGQYLANLLAYGNISVHKGNGDSQVVMLGGYNTHTQVGNGNAMWLAAGGFNVMTHVGKGDVASALVGGANVLTKFGNGDLISGMLGGANIITHISDDMESSDTTAIALGGANILTKKGKGNSLAVMGGGANVMTHVGDGSTTGVMLGGANILTKVGHGNTTGVMLGVGNVLTHVGDGQTIGVMGAVGNIFTKVGDGTSIAAMVGGGNIFTHVGEGDAWALMGGVGNVFTKVGDGNALALMVAAANVYTHIGDGLSVALMVAKGNIATKIGNGTTMAAMVGAANIFTHIGDGNTFAAMVGKANILTKVGNELTAGLMVGTANIFTHVGDGTSIGLFAGKANIMTKVGDGTTLAAMFGKANIMTHVGDGLTGVLALGEANIVTKVGDDFMGVVAAAKANVVTHVGDATTAAVLAGKGNILTKVGDGTTVGLLLSDIGNVMTHVGDGMTLGFAKGKANIITKVGDGLGVNAGWGNANVFTHVGEGNRYNFAKGEANLITKVGDGQEVSVVHGKANIITHIGDGNDYTGAWGKANVITKVGDGCNVVLAKGEANIVTQVGNGDSFNALWSKGNIVTKVGDGMQVTAAKGKANITTTVGNGLSVTAAYGDANINTKVGDGISVNVAWGKYNVNTKVGDGLNVAVMKGKANVNIHVGDGLGINASYAQNNVAIKIGNGDFYSLAVASSNTKSNKLSSLFDTIKQTVLGVGGSQAINYLVHGDDASSSGTRKGRGAIATPEITKLDGFQMDEIEEVGTDLGDNLVGGVSDVKTPDLSEASSALDVTEDSDKEAQTQSVNGYARQSNGGDDALADKERAEADRQRLEQEKEKQLAAVSGSQAQLESTDQEALASNGQVQREAVKGESDAVTEELTAMTQGLDKLDGHKVYRGESGNSWREHFAGGILDDVEAQLDQSKAKTSEYLIKSQQQIAESKDDVKDSVAKSEAGVAKGEQNRAGAEQDITDAKVEADNRKAEALAQQSRAKAAENEARSASDDARSRGEQDKLAAESEASQAQADAEGSKKNEGDRPDREGASGSGLSGKQYQGHAEADTTSHVDAEGQTRADGRFSEGLTDEEQDALDGATQAVNRLQINAGVRAKNTGASITSMFTKATDNKVAASAKHGSQDVRRKEIQVLGVNLEGLGELAEASAAVIKAVDGFDFSLLGTDDVSFIDSTKRQFGKLSTDLPSKELRAVRRNIQYVQRMPSEDNLVALELVIQQWQQKNPKEFAQRSELVKPLQFEIALLQSHIQANRAKDADVFGIAIDPKAAEGFESKVVFDGIGRVAGLVEPLAENELSRLKSLEVVSPTQTNSKSEREAAKTESESIVEFVYKLSQVNATEADASEISQLVDQAKALWMSGNVTHETAVTLFSEAHDKLAAHPELQTLAGKLLSDAQKEKATGQYLDNLFGRRFDSEIAHELVKTPTEQAINTSVQIGTNLVNDFDEWMHTLLPDAADDTLRDERIQKKMEAFAKAINKDARPWFSRVPTLTQFLETPNYENFKTMMTQVDDGFGVIKVPFLAVKMAITPGLGMEMAPWKAEGDRFYQNVITKARSTSAVISTGVDGENQVNLIEKKTSGYGTALHYQPKGDAYGDFQEGRSVADGRILTPGKETTFESNALNKGLSVVTGASGSTNIMMHLNQHLASKNPGFSVDQAYLNTLAFLVFDGGHSVNESLAVYKALQESGDDRRAVLESYTANYQDLVELAGDDSKDVVRTALDNAFDKTLEFYKEHAHSASEELEALGGKRKHLSVPMNEMVAMDNDGTPPRDKASLSPLTRYFNNELYGSKKERRYVDDITSELLNYAVSEGGSEKVTLKGEAGRLTGYYHQGNPNSEGEQTSVATDKVVLFLHGSGSSVEEQAISIYSHYQKLGIDMLAVNMRGFGESDGGPSEKGLYQDARTMFNYLVNDKGINPSNIIIHGYSMGAPIAADLARFAAQNGQAVSGLLLDRPMPSMSKAITAKEVFNPAGIAGVLSKAVNGQFSVEKNLDGLPKETPIMLLTDEEGLGKEGEKLRSKLDAAGYQVSGESTSCKHEDSNRLMGQYADQIVSRFADSQHQLDDSPVTHKVDKNYQSRDLVLEPIKQPEMIELGMPEADQRVLAKIADRENVIIGVRPVDEKSKSLIDSKMYSSKGLFVKAKSSDWGPMSGFIPVDQSFAKASARRDLEKFNGYAEQSIQSGNAVSADLYLNQRRVDDLVSKYHSLTAPELDAESGMYKTTATNGDQTVSFFLNNVTVDGKELWQVHYMKDGELAPFKVIGDPISKQPMTADYDLLTVMHAYGDLGPKDKVKQPLTWEQWKESVTYEDLTPKYKELYDNEALYNKKDGASLGIVNDRLKELKDVINTGLGRTNGLEMVHHGADDANPYAVMADNFPATFFVPKSFFEEDGLGEGKGSIQTYFNVNEQGAVVIRNPQEFSNFQQVAINASYRGAFNDKWNAGLDKPLFTKDEKRSHAFLDARDELAKKLNGGDKNELESLGPKRRPGLKLNIDTSMTPLERRKAEYQKQGILVASGSFGLVIRDPNDASVLIKYVGQAYETAKAESKFFNQFYGEESSQVYRDANGDVFLKMLKVPGVPVADLSPENMPDNAKELFLKMVSDLSEASIYHRDLHLGNVMYDAESQRFWPIDFESAVDFESNEHLKANQADAVMFEKSLRNLAKQKLEKLNGNLAKNQDVQSWDRVAVSPQADGGETRFDGQIIIQTENDPVAAKAAARLAGKHPENSVVVQLDADGKYRVVYGEPSQLSGKLRWQVVGHGRDESETNNTRLSGYSADELAEKLVKFNQDFSQAENIIAKPDHISIVGCSLVSDDKQKGFGNRFITAMDANGIRSDVSARSTEMAVDATGRKFTRDGNDKWAHNLADNKVVLTWSEQGEVLTRNEAIRNGIAEGDIDLARVGQSDSDAPARGAIGDNSDVFTAPEKRKNSMDTASSNGSDRHLSYSGNIQVNVGDGEFTAVNWGTSNVGIKVGTGGFKSLAFGDNNVMVHVGNGDSKHSFDMAGYQALEGAQMFIGNRNVSFNMGRSNDLIVMMDKSIPTPPLVNPFDGASRISGVLQGIARSGEGQDWLAAQEKQWTLSGAKKFVKDMSGLDLSSSVDYTSLIDLDSQHERSSRGLKHDAEATLNKQYNKWLSGNSNSDTSKMSRADKFRQANEKLAFNFAVGGQGADIQVTTGNWNFMFGDNIQSILDTNLGSLFGLMTQQFSATGQAKTTFTYNPQDLPRQLKNKLLGKLAGVGAETTLGDIFGVDYTAGGHIVSRNGESVDGVAILKEMLEVIGEFSGDQLQAFTDPAKLLDSLKSGIDMGADGIKSFAESHGLKEKAPDEEEDKSSVSVNGANTAVAEQTAVEQTASADSTKQERAFGFNALNLPNLFATIFSQDKQTEMKSLVENLKDNLTADLLNMKEQTFDFLRNSGHLQGDGDINVSLGNYNFNWGGDGKDLGAYLGDNNNFWGGRGDDVYYATGTSNIFTGGEGNDMGVLMGRENMMFGGDGNDTAVVAGRINHVFMGAGDDQSFVFGEGGEINTGTGRDYVVTSGNFNSVDTGEDQDYSVTIGNNNQVELGGGNDFANVFGNYNRVNGSAGNDVIKLMGYHAVLNGGEGDDHLIAAAISKFSQFDGGQGRDMMVLGGYQNTFKGGEDVDSFIVSGNVIDNLVEDIRSEDNIVFNGVDWQNLWFERSGYDLKLSVLREPEAETDQAKFESVGSVTFDDYFNGNRAELVIGMGEKDAAGEREYTALSDNAVDALVQAMSSFAPQAGDNGFIDNLDSKARVAVTTAWSDVTNGKGAIA